MPATLTYPGVYIEEVSSGVRTITGVATSITAFIGRAERGPVDKAVTINSYGDFERIFGGLWNRSKMSFAVRDFYMNGGSRAIVVRLFAPTFADETARQKALTAATTVAQTAADAVKSAVDTAAAAAGATAQSVATAAQGAVVAASGPGAPAAASAAAVAKAAADAVALAAADAQSVKTAVGGAVAGAVASAAAAEAPVTRAKLAADTLNLEAAYEGEWGNALRARIDHEVSADVATSFGLAASDLFNLTVRDTSTGTTEQFRNVTVVDSPRKVTKVLENESRLVRVSGNPPAARPTPHGAPDLVNDPEHPDPLTNAASSSKVDATGKASNGKALTESNFTGTGKEAAKEGLFALEGADLFNLLCIPPYVDNGAGGNIEHTLIDKVIPYCVKRRAMLLIDPRDEWKTKENAMTGVAAGVGTASKNAALFFPRLRQPNPLRNGQVEDFVPCGAVAGLFARTDTQRGVWKAPAGLEATLFGVPELSVGLTDPENGELNLLGINCLRTLPAAGRVVWGSRTRVGDDRLASEWKYIPVRRTALFIEESLYRGTQWVVFEPNAEPLWAQIRLNLGAFMHSLFRQGAFQGQSPREAYLVKCDKETTTQDDINKGIVNIIVGFAPLKPAEFVILKIQQLAGQIQV